MMTGGRRMTRRALFAAVATAANILRGSRLHLPAHVHVIEPPNWVPDPDPDRGPEARALIQCIRTRRRMAADLPDLRDTNPQGYHAVCRWYQRLLGVD